MCGLHLFFLYLTIPAHAFATMLFWSFFSCLTSKISRENKKKVCHPDKADYNAYQIHADNYSHNTNGTAVKITQSLSTIKKHSR